MSPAHRAARSGRPRSGSARPCCACAASSPGCGISAPATRRRPRWTSCVTSRARAGFLAADPAGLARACPPHAAAPAEGRRLRAAGAGDWLGRRRERFVLGLALAARLDAALGPVFAQCRNDAAGPGRRWALAQRLWDDPLAVLAAADPRGRCAASASSLAQGDRPVRSASSLLARWVAGPDRPASASSRSRPPRPTRSARRSRAPAAPPARLEVDRPRRSTGADAGGHWSRPRLRSGRTCWRRRGRRRPARSAWLAGADLLLPIAPGRHARRSRPSRDPPPRAARPPGLPAAHHGATSSPPCAVLDIGPVVPPRADRSCHPRGADCCRRSAPGPAAWRPRSPRPPGTTGWSPRPSPASTAGLAASPAACPRVRSRGGRAECHVDFHGLAEPVAPALRPRRHRAAAGDPAASYSRSSTPSTMSAASTTTGAAPRRWPTAGSRALRRGARDRQDHGGGGAWPATLDLPLYRIDLSQVVNKYIGETEKNLRRVFDAAEQMRCDPLLRRGRRAVRQAHRGRDANDRFANIETGYLLQRMERFCGVAMLATNRRRDLDEAFSRRLRLHDRIPGAGRGGAAAHLGAGIPPEGRSLAPSTSPSSPGSSS